MAQFLGTTYLVRGVIQWTETVCDGCGGHDSASHTEGHHHGWPIITPGWKAHVDGSCLRTLCPTCQQGIPQPLGLDA